ncbi:stage V sporulation protein AA [Bacillus mesophilus]|uniref:Stage V sporulation protein AA n=1 Tax=Bacillus mesophilus TaxID=1808955 RepID=A0A6M0Q4L4_9BACI|nr:stage V sporulation protein AA [Bacillus mesophilus]MBM7661145.1 stage V sporulation protein AA [Bacillus mesophilus]NEY71327.1 stage V sporulation protein AA [Bacillus mesophilus]
MEETLYLRMRHKINVKPNHTVTIGDLAQIISNDSLKKEVQEKIVYHINMSDRNIVVIDVMTVIEKIYSFFPDVDIQVTGASQTIVEIEYKKRNFSPVFFIGVWLLLFVGAALAIMNFHEDVSMREVHQRIYYIITGEAVEKPLLLQIPYSLGLGLGMVLFFNHLFRKRINEEPSPLEVEMFNYQQDLDRYVMMNENKESTKKLDDH